MSDFSRPRELRDGAAFSAADIRAHYNLPSGTPSNGSQAALEFWDQFFSPEQLERFMASQQEKNHAGISVIGHNDVDHPTLEGEMDMEILLGVTPEVPVVYYKTEQWNKTYGRDPYMLSYAVDANNRTDAPLVSGVCYSVPETHLPPGYVTRANYELAKLALRGHTVVAASGDNGSTDQNCTQHAATFPQSSPYVLVVGATVGGKNGAEVPVSSNPISGQYWTTGAGFSAVLPQPWYQTSAVSQYLQEVNTTAGAPKPSDYTAGGRAYPDITGIGENVISTYDGAILPMGLGTSATAPMYASILAKLNGELIAEGRPPVGLVNPVLYAAKKVKGVLGDVHVPGLTTAGGGCDTGFPSSAGAFDAVVGLGPLADYQLLAKFVRALTPQSVVV